MKSDKRKKDPKKDLKQDYPQKRPKNIKAETKFWKKAKEILRTRAFEREIKALEKYHSILPTSDMKILVAPLKTEEDFQKILDSFLLKQPSVCFLRDFFVYGVQHKYKAGTLQFAVLLYMLGVSSLIPLVKIPEARPYFVRIPKDKDLQGYLFSYALPERFYALYHDSTNNLIAWRSKTGENLAHVAMKRKDIGLLRDVARQCPELLLSQVNGPTPLWSVVAGYQMPIPDLLGNNFCDYLRMRVLAENKAGDTLLFHAARAGCIEKIKRCVRFFGPECLLQRQQRTQETLADRALKFGQIRVLDYLQQTAPMSTMSNGLVIPHLFKGDDLQVLVFSAVRWKQVEGLRWLLRHYPDCICYSDHTGQNVLHFFFAQPYDDQDTQMAALFQCLLLNSQSLYMLQDRQNAYGLPPLFLAVLNGRVNMLKLVLKYCAPLWFKVKGPNGETLVDCAMQCEQIPVLDFLRENALFSIDEVSKTGAPLRRRKIQVLKWLGLHYPSWMKQPASDGNTIFHWFCLQSYRERYHHQDEELFQYFCTNYPALIHLENKKKYVPIVIAAAKGRIDLLECFVTYVDPESLEGIYTTCRMTLAHFAAQNNQISVLNYLYQKNPKYVSHLDVKGDPPIFTAVKGGAWEVVSWYAENDRNALKFCSKSGQSVLWLVAQEAQPDNTLEAAINRIRKIQALHLISEENPEAYEEVTSQGTLLECAIHNKVEYVLAYAKFAKKGKRDYPFFREPALFPILEQIDGAIERSVRSELPVYFQLWLAPPAFCYSFLRPIAGIILEYATILPIPFILLLAISKGGERSREILCRCAKVNYKADYDALLAPEGCLKPVIEIIEEKTEESRAVELIQVVISHEAAFKDSPAAANRILSEFWAPSRSPLSVSAPDVCRAGAAPLDGAPPRLG